jgi:hypothetical protein
MRKTQPNTDMALQIFLCPRVHATGGIGRGTLTLASGYPVIPDVPTAAERDGKHKHVLWAAD